MVYRSEPKRSGAATPVKLLSLRESESDANNRDSYDRVEESDASEVELKEGQAIDYGAEGWLLCVSMI